MPTSAATELTSLAGILDLANVDTVPEAMIVIDAKGSVTSFSAAAAQLFG
jgi:hypothetical protein